MVPSGRGGPARQKWTSRDIGRCMALGYVRRPLGGLKPDNTRQRGLGYLQRLCMNTLRMDFVGAFLELWLGIASLEFWLEMEDGLHFIEQSLVVASDVANLVSRVQIVIRIRNSTWSYGVCSPYMFVIADDRVIHYTRADDIAGGTSDA
ncbi:hypothetical protein DEO72_LG7g1591 [Vigna unguiculata]|uniref:Uncharacterized protein n=1 Tax=Vigna unguiculata TaxID=3917 RepID=A0A4D6MHW3_VIGUN|nr:hypothetical protein DEO72_LG7g1591 [Vigna unguiculata]